MKGKGSTGGDLVNRTQLARRLFGDDATASSLQGVPLPEPVLWRGGKQSRPYYLYSEVIDLIKNNRGKPANEFDAEQESRNAVSFALSHIQGRN